LVAQPLFTIASALVVALFGYVSISQVTSLAGWFSCTSEEAGREFSEMTMCSASLSSNINGNWLESRLI